jgi:membrane associated rhomboid family serine protease
MNQMRLAIPPFSTTLKVLIGINLGVWIIAQMILERYADVPFTKFFALYPGKVLLDGSVWQLVTYMFLHSMSVMHIVFNMLMLWMIGSELETRWGRKFFLAFYFGTGFGAAVIYCAGVGIYAAMTGNHQGLVIPVIGASGAIFG